MPEATEIDYWRRAVRSSQMEKVTNDEIHSMMARIGDIKTKQLSWFGQVQ